MSSSQQHLTTDEDLLGGEEGPSSPSPQGMSIMHNNNGGDNNELRSEDYNVLDEGTATTIGPFVNDEGAEEDGEGVDVNNSTLLSVMQEGGAADSAAEDGRRLILSATKEGVPELQSVPQGIPEDGNVASVHMLASSLAASSNHLRKSLAVKHHEVVVARDIAVDDVDDHQEEEDVQVTIAATLEEGEDDRTEEERDVEWRLRRKHIFILNSAGRPIFTRHGDESDFVDLFGIFQVLVSMASAASLCGSDGAGEIDALRRITAGPHHTMHFHNCGDLIYVMVSRTAESPKACLRQLKLIHSQVISVLPTANAILKKNASYDIRRMFSTADIGVLKMLIKRMSTEPIYHFRAMHAVAILPDMRKETDSILKNNHCDEDHMFSFLIHDIKVVSVVTPPKSPVHPDDMLLLLNFTNCLSRTQSGVCWAPICLPKFNDTGYLWCYCCNVSIACREEVLRTGGKLTPSMVIDDSASTETAMDPMVQFKGEKGILLVMVGTSQEMFATLDKAGQSIVVSLTKNSLYAEIESISNNATLIPFDAALTVEDKLSPPLVLWYTLVSETGQLISSTISPMIAFSKTTKKAVLRQWVKMKDKLSQTSTATNPVMIATLDDLSYLVVRQRGLGDVYGVFLPSMGKTDMLRWATRWCKWAREREKTYTIVKAVTW